MGRRPQSCVCVLEPAPTHTHLTGAHLLGCCVRRPTDRSFKVSQSDTQLIKRKKLNKKKVVILDLVFCCFSSRNVSLL